MTYPRELVKLVCENLEVLEDAPRVVEEVSDALFGAVNRRLGARLAQLPGWSGLYENSGHDLDGETAILPPGWPVSRGGAYMACYELSYLKTGGGAKMYWLSIACGVREQMTWQFTLSSDHHKMSDEDFKARLADFYNVNPALAENGLLLEDDHLQLLFSFDRAAVIDEFPKYAGNVLAPLDAALDKLFAVHPLIDGFVKSFARK